MAGGPIETVGELRQYEQPSLWVGADKGISTLISLGVFPDIVFGDFDSINKEDLEKIKSKNVEIFQFPEEKDDTDLGLALEWALSQKPELIRIFGNTGGRMDHTMAGVQLLVSPKTLDSNVHVEIIDQVNCLYAVRPGVYQVEKKPLFKYISFIPMAPEVRGITLKGFKYPLENKNIKMGTNLCVSNELISQIGHFSFTSGILLVVRSKD